MGKIAKAIVSISTQELPARRRPRDPRPGATWGSIDLLTERSALPNTISHLGLPLLLMVTMNLWLGTRK